MRWAANSATNGAMTGGRVVPHCGPLRRPPGRPIVSRLNPYHWHPDKTERVGRRISGVFRWVLIVICVGAVVGFTAAMVTGVRDDLALAHNGVPVTATVIRIDKAPKSRRMRVSNEKSLRCRRLLAGRKQSKDVPYGRPQLHSSAHFRDDRYVTA